MKKENLIIGAIAVFGALTLFNTYKIFSKKNRTVPTYTNTVQPTNNQGANFPNANPQNNFQNQPQAKPQAAPAAPVGPATTVNFTKPRHEFGEVLQNTTNKHTFEFTNTGTEPLVISNAKGSCGCTVPQWPREPIAPGASGDITVEFNSDKKTGKRNQQVTITANTTPPQSIIRSVGNVTAKAGGAAADNASPIQINPGGGK